MKTSEFRKLIRKEVISELKYVGGLHQAKPGDYISIGIEGTRIKHILRIDKIVANNRLQDEYGDIFDRNGIIYRRKSSAFKSWNDKKRIVSAKIVTQKEFDNQYKDIKINFLRKYEWHKEDIQTINNVIKQLKIQQGSRLNISRFE